MYLFSPLVAFSALVCRKPDIHQAVQKVKDTHDECTRRQDARLKELERLGQQLKEEKVRRSGKIT
jgi:hypothetical protein